MDKWDDYKFILKYNDLHVVQRYSTKDKEWKDVAIFIPPEKAKAKMNELITKDSKKHKVPHKFRITYLKQTGGK